MSVYLLLHIEGSTINMPSVTRFTFNQNHVLVFPPWRYPTVFHNSISSCIEPVHSSRVCCSRTVLLLTVQEKALRADWEVKALCQWKLNKAILYSNFILLLVLFLLSWIWKQVNFLFVSKCPKPYAQRFIYCICFRFHVILFYSFKNVYLLTYLLGSQSYGEREEVTGKDPPPSSLLPG